MERKTARATFTGAIVLLVVLFVSAGCAPAAAPAAEPIVIGAPLSTGFVYGWDAERGIKLAVDEINAAGGVNVGGTKRPFKVEVLDTRDLEPSVPVSDALLTVEKLILEKKADFIMGGPVRSEAALAALDLLTKHKKVSILTTGALTPSYHKKINDEYDKYKYAFRISGESGWMVKEMLDVLDQIKADYGFTKIYIMIQDVAHARSGGDILKAQLPTKGWTVLGLDVYPGGTTDFSTGLLKVKDSQAQVMILWMDMPESSILLKQWYDLKVPALPFGSILNAAEQPGFWKATEGKGEFVIANLVNAGNAATKVTDWAPKFFDAYKAKYGIEPEAYGTASSYMGPYVLKDAIERAKSLEPDAVIKALEQTNLMGVYGKISFNPKSHQVVPSYEPAQGAVGSMIQWQAGNRVTIFPPQAATGKILLPSWVKPAK